MQSTSLATLVGLSIRLKSLSMVRGSEKGVCFKTHFIVKLWTILVHKRLPHAHVIVSSDGVCKAPSNLALIQIHFFMFDMLEIERKNNQFHE